ncbi:MAG: chemotaxis response regulator protein-glutamate methylesterase [Thermodesulfovibrio sp.]|uniref:protein-glutamate methylesterase/protein-glutamine glutaminase n=1 Tax=unclassified Thermodesulfovibrio TaxID=2645936 RepID=UPI00083AB682|nr:MULTISPECIES: chemotaxis response regulator protein-glutamate methylesterase [unclassified Thermodesulfovibrio]MDI1472378.1 chemotaxis response regulator protein-glutamate methylesterase [Thermodesulfovibrio sp. 1176]MDI6714243.1 chemotaxis response regulator protein-glutamate methylesterase [Thermodesulfovibrio sp.]ODA43943.1 Chemotaxis response regulator protein-glutamate methylesterase CheB [Thermodesulfovibrio sp. N1]
MTKILIVDDSALMRKLLREIFEKEGDFVIETARNGKEAIEKNLSFQPDVITLDINMPEMDGITALAHIMNQRPVPVVMVSSLTEKGAIATFEALNLGAVDYVTKPGGTISLNIDEIRDEIISKVRSATKAKLKAKALVRKIREEREKILRPAPPKEISTKDERLVLIGVSTGGPRTLEEILPELPSDFPMPVIVAQHMPPTFTKSFAERLNSICELNVVEVDHPMPVETGTIYIGKGGTDVVLTRRAQKLIVHSKPENPSFLWHPSVEILGRSALESCDPQKIIAVMLTGMGHDGADAFTEIKKRGGKTIAESEDSAVVFGMPRELIERGGATVVLPAEKIAKQLIKWAKNNV